MLDLNDINVVNELLDRAIAEKGADYKYKRVNDGCVYIDNGAPSCIMGHVFVYAGADMSIVAENEGKCASEVIRALGFDVAREVEFLVDVTQGNQDINLSWGDAVNEGRNHILMA